MTKSELTDFIAIQAMSALIQWDGSRHKGATTILSQEEGHKVSRLAYVFADSMMAERQRRIDEEKKG